MLACTVRATWAHSAAAMASVAWPRCDRVQRVTWATPLPTEGVQCRTCIIDFDKALRAPHHLSLRPSVHIRSPLERALHSWSAPPVQHGRVGGCQRCAPQSKQQCMQLMHSDGHAQQSVHVWCRVLCRPALGRRDGAASHRKDSTADGSGGQREWQPEPSFQIAPTPCY